MQKNTFAARGESLYHFFSRTGSVLLWEQSMRLLIKLGLCVALTLTVSCGGSKGGSDGDGGTDGDGAVGNGDGGAGEVDALTLPNCTPDLWECSNCIDDDGDGDIDGFDVECAGPLDRDEGSFATGIPGDNMDEKLQDCFFDGNSGGGNDCAWHTCCLLTGPCPTTIDMNFDPADCQVTQTTQCIIDCAPITPPGCDCFGCCTVCDAAGCVDVLLNAEIAPQCDETAIHDPTKCFTCGKNTECATPCNNDNCELCPGQTAEDLPDSCNAVACPDGLQVCDTATPCPSNTYCSGGCCIAIIE
jgi:hypothetical protein